MSMRRGVTGHCAMSSVQGAPHSASGFPQVHVLLPLSCQKEKSIFKNLLGLLLGRTKLPCSFPYLRQCAAEGLLSTREGQAAEEDSRPGLLLTPFLGLPGVWGGAQWPFAQEPPEPCLALLLCQLL